MFILCVLCAIAVVAMLVVCLLGLGGSTNRDLEKRLEQRAEDRAGGHVPSPGTPSERGATEEAAAGTRLSTTAP